MRLLDFPTIVLRSDAGNKLAIHGPPGELRFDVGYVNLKILLPQPLNPKPRNLKNPETPKNRDTPENPETLKNNLPPYNANILQAFNS